MNEVEVVKDERYTATWEAALIPIGREKESRRLVFYHPSDMRYVYVYLGQHRYSQQKMAKDLKVLLKKRAKNRVKTK